MSRPTKAQTRALLGDGYTAHAMAGLYGAMNLLHCMVAAAEGASEDQAGDRLEKMAEAARGVIRLLDFIYVDLDKAREFWGEFEGGANAPG